MNVNEGQGPSIPSRWVVFEKSLGARIRAGRLARGMSLAKLSQELGISYQQLHKYESGANRISIARLAHVAEILGVKLIDFILLPADGLRVGQTPDQDSLMAAQLIADFGKIKSQEEKELVCKLASSFAGDNI